MVSVYKRSVSSPNCHIRTRIRTSVCNFQNFCFINIEILYTILSFSNLMRSSSGDSIVPIRMWHSNQFPCDNMARMEFWTCILAQRQPFRRVTSSYQFILNTRSTSSSRLVTVRPNFAVNPAIATGTWGISLLESNFSPFHNSINNPWGIYFCSHALTQTKGARYLVAPWYYDVLTFLQYIWAEITKSISFFFKWIPFLFSPCSIFPSFIPFHFSYLIF